MKIAIFHLAFIYSGGGERLVLEEAKGLKKLGHDVDIFACLLDKKRCFPDLIRKFTIKTFLPQLTLIVPKHESFLVILACILSPLLSVKFRKYDVILAANQPSPWIAWWAKMLYGIPYVSYLAQPTRFLYPRNIDNEMGLIFSKKASDSVTTKAMNKAKRFIDIADKISIKASDAVLANGEYIKRVLDKTYKIKSLPCPAGAYLGKKVKSQRSKVKGLLYTGSKKVIKPFLLITNRHFAQKRFEYGIFALSSVLQQFPEYTLIITGKETDYTNEVKVLIRRLNLTDKVIFLNHVGESDLTILYKNCSAYLYTAPEEDFGMGIIEAMAQGAPVVAWDNAGPGRIINDGKTGLLVKPYDASDFADKVLKIVEDSTFANKIGLNAAREVKEKFSYDLHIKVLEKTLASQKRG
jgi:glycosyltransferase involved in cell wall biosynthesis